MSSHESERLRQRVAQLLSDIEKEFDNLIDENDALRRKLKQQEGITGGRHSPPRAERARSKSEKRGNHPSHLFLLPLSLIPFVSFSNHNPSKDHYSLTTNKQKKKR